MHIRICEVVWVRHHVFYNRSVAFLVQQLAHYGQTGTRLYYLPAQLLRYIVLFLDIDASLVEGMV